MKALLLRDILCQKKLLPLYGLYSIIFFLMFGIVNDPPDITLVMVLSSVAVGYMILMASFKADKNDTPRFMLSLPILRREAVHEKFLLLFLGTLFGFACTGFLSVLFRLGGDRFISGSIDWYDLLRIFSGMLILSFLLPLYFRFGHLAVRYFLIVVMALGVILQVILLILIGINTGGVNIIDSIIGWFTQYSILKRNLILGAVGLGIYIVSYLVSYRVYTRKDI